MTTWLSDGSANRHRKTYVRDFLDVSGNFTARSDGEDMLYIGTDYTNLIPGVIGFTNNADSSMNTTYLGDSTTSKHLAVKYEPYHDITRLCDASDNTLMTYTRYSTTEGKYPALRGTNRSRYTNEIYGLTFWGLCRRNTPAKEGGMSLEFGKEMPLVRFDGAMDSVAVCYRNFGQRDPQNTVAYGVVGAQQHYIGYFRRFGLDGGVSRQSVAQTTDYMDGEFSYGFAIHGGIMTDQQVIAGNGIVMVSDERIKTNIQPINDESALEKLRLLNPCTYNYLDTANKGFHTVDGFIAQEVKEIMPHAVTTQRYKIPNVYKPATFAKIDASDNVLDASNNVLDVSNNIQVPRDASNNVIGEAYSNVILNISNYDTANLEVDASGNIYSELVLYDASNGQHTVQITNVISSTSLEIAPTSELPDEFMIYGQIVDDFHAIAKDYIFTVATAALQEIDRQLQAEKVKKTTLETQIADLRLRVNTLKGQ